MRLKALPFLALLLPLLLSGGCSSEEACGDTVCTAGEVCENNQCVLGLSFGDEDGADACHGDENCPVGKVCTLPGSDPASTCIRILICDRDRDCQSGLTCSQEGICR